MSQRAAIHLGTSSFTAQGWAGSFYPENMKPAEYLRHYAGEFDTVRVDSTFYRTPVPNTVRGWNKKTPANFLFAAKGPQAITHEKVLVDCSAELRGFLGAMDQLREKLRPLLFQFPYFNRAKFSSEAEFLALLVPFLESLPRGYRFAVEIRNKAWLDNRLLEALGRRGVALALIDHPWLPRPAELLRRINPLTADFAYIRWLGDRKAIEEKTDRGTRRSSIAQASCASGRTSSTKSAGAASPSSPTPIITSRDTRRPRCACSRDCSRELPGISLPVGSCRTGIGRELPRRAVNPFYMSAMR